MTDTEAKHAAESVKLVPRKWIPAPGAPADAAAEHSDHDFTVMHWNILADGLAQHGEFVKTPADVLTWEYRLPRIVEEIRRVQPDIVLLVEMNMLDDLARELAKLNLTVAAHVPKHTSAAVGLGFPVDGAVLFVSPRFTLKEMHALAFHHENGSAHPQRGLCAILNDTKHESALCVVGGHLKAKAGAASDTMREQEAHQMLAALDKHVPADMPTIIMGDWNTDPHTLPVTLVDSSPRGFVQSYTADVRPFTTWKFRPVGQKHACIDYMWATKHAAALQIFSIPSEEDIGPAALPSAEYPSDHLSLATKYHWST